MDSQILWGNSESLKINHLAHKMYFLKWKAICYLCCEITLYCHMHKSLQCYKKVCISQVTVLGFILCCFCDLEHTSCQVHPENYNKVLDLT